MIWHSTLLMTLFDILIITITFASLAVLFHQWSMLVQSRLHLSAVVVEFGLLGVGLFYLTDLSIMWVLPLYTSHSQSMTYMEILHLNYSWVVMLVATISIFTGFAFMMKRMLAQTTMLSEEVVERKKAEVALKKNETMLAEAQRVAHVGSWEVDIPANKRLWSDEMCRIFEVESKQSVDSYEAYLEIIYPDDRARFDKVYIDAINNNERHYGIEQRLLMKDGRVKYVYQKCENIFDENGELVRTIGTVIDITDRKQAEEALLESNERFRAAFADAAIGMALVSLEHSIMEANQSFSEMLGYSKDELVGIFFKDITHPDDVELSLEHHHQLIAGEIDNYHLEKRYLHKQGHQIWVLLSTSLVRDKDTTPLYVVAQIQDITKRKQADDQLSYQASHDALTGLVNRREFERRAERLLATIQQDKGEHALCFMDLDQFKVVNDTCGHAAGDEMLRQLSSLLQEVVRYRDTLARLGGDEFGVLMEHCSLEDAHRVVTTLQKAIQDYQFSWEGQSFRVGVSMGLVPITITTANVNKLLSDADLACYMAKDKGRNRIHVYYAEDAEMAQRHGEMQWVTRINQALEQDRFCLYAQSIVPLDGRTNEHCELLIRMIGENGEIIPPGAFLPAAERYNLISKLDRWVIDTTFEMLEGHPLFMKDSGFCSINLSGQSLAEMDFQEYVINKFSDTKIPPGKICFEITETAAITNLSSVILFITKMKLLGCRFAMDDFGRGLSSFAYLKSLPVDYLKIDGMFVKDIVDDPINHAMVKSINEIGQVMGMHTIAEFVENDEIKGMLREIGVNYAQGYGVSKPISIDKILLNFKQN